MGLRRTPLFDWHTAHGGRMVEFGGWEMPVQYSGIVFEHQAVRKAAGLFDISHMGRLSFQGDDSLRLLDQLLTCRVDNLVDGQVRYGLVCNQNGFILDDVLVNRIDATHFGLVVNASNREKIVDWIGQQRGALLAGSDQKLTCEDQTTETAMLAIQGPQGLALLSQLAGTSLRLMKYYTGQTILIGGVSVFVSRTGYTGDDGVELILPPAAATPRWERLMGAGGSFGLKPCGLGCRDTLRLEAAMPLYGHELSDQVDPLTAGLGFAVNLNKPPFIGREALIAIGAQSQRPVRVGLKLGSRRIAREHSPVFAGDERIGEVTSGTFSPTLEQSIAMAYVPAAWSQWGSSLEVDIRGKREAATVVSLPFYNRAK